MISNKIENQDCFLCRKHAGGENQPPGGYIYSDKHWLVCHAPVDKGPLGTLFIESRRHILDFADMNEEELNSYGQLLQRLYLILKELAHAERIYSVVMLEGIPHFHSWFIPRRSTDAEKGMAFLNQDLRCQEDEVMMLAGELHEKLNRPA